IGASGTISSSATSAAFQASSNPATSATASLLQLGGTIAGGSANGTFIGINPAAFTGNFADFQVGGSSVFTLTAAGNLTAAGTLNGLTVSSGTVSGGVWQGTAVADAYVADTLTIDGSSSVQWVALTGYPTACPAGEAVTAVGDTLTC